MRVKSWKLLWTKQYTPIVFITILALCIRLYELPNLMPFIGDQAWFYLSARDALTQGNIPLVGITASRTWLHQGAYWTYLLVPLLKLGAYNPVVPAYFTAILGSLCTVCIYGVLRSLNEKRTAFIGALLYATSPLVIMSDRMPYHTSPTPLLMVGIYFTLWKIIQGQTKFWTVLIALLAMMHNFNLAGMSVIYFIGGVAFIGAVTKQAWITQIPRQIYLHSILVWSILTMPFIVYDVSHGFPQTLKFFAWLIMQPFSLLTGSSSSYSEMAAFMAVSAQRLIFFPSAALSLIILGLSLMFALWYSLRYVKTWKDPLIYTVLWTLCMILVVTAGKTPSHAYIYTLYPLVIMLLAQVLGVLIHVLEKSKVFVIGLVCIVGVINCWTLVQSNYLMGVRGGYGAPLSARIKLAQTIIDDAEGASYSLKVVGPGANFSSTPMYMEYLTWWLGNAPTAGESKKIYEIFEQDGQLRMRPLIVSEK